MSYKSIIFTIIFILGITSNSLGQDLQSGQITEPVRKTFVAGIGYASGNIINASPLKFNVAFGFGRMQDKIQRNWTLRYGQLRSMTADSSQFAREIEIEYDRDKLIYNNFTIGHFLRIGYSQFDANKEITTKFPIYRKRISQSTGFDFGYQKRIGKVLIKPKLEINIFELSIYYQNKLDPNLSEIAQVVWGPDFSVLREIAFSIEMVYLFK